MQIFYLNYFGLKIKLEKVFFKKLNLKFKFLK